MLETLKSCSLGHLSLGMVSAALGGLPSCCHGGPRSEGSRGGYDHTASAFPAAVLWPDRGFLADCCWSLLTAVPCQRSRGVGLALAQGEDKQLGSPGKHLLGSANEDVLGSAGHRFLETGLIVQPDLVSVLCFSLRALGSQMGMPSASYVRF